MKKIYCDRCGREIGDYDPTNFTQGKFTIYYKPDDDNRIYATTLLGTWMGVDLCRTCEEELAGWLFGDPVNR